MKFHYSRPLPPVETADEETVLEDDSELLLERIEEEMAADEPGSEDDEDLFFNVDDLNKVSRTNTELFPTRISICHIDSVYS